jgi:type I restriction enzyme S subunit
MIKPYDKYKESGIEWIGQIPKEWSQTQLKYISSISKGRKAKDDYQDFKEGMIPYLSMEYLRNQTESPSYVFADDSSIVLVDEKDLLILWDGSKAGEIVKAKKGALSSTMGKIHVESDLYDLNFLSYYLKNAERFIQSNTVGMGIPHVSGEVLRTLFITFPNRNEQTTIANYLDHQTVIIDQLIQQKEKLIAMLKEKRQAVINEAVTKGLPAEAAAKAGLNPNAKMKDSGIEWLGEVPAEWNIKRLRYLGKCQNGVSQGSEYLMVLWRSFCELWSCL